MSNNYDEYYMNRYGPYLSENNLIMQGKPRKYQCMGCAYENMWSPIDLETLMCLNCVRYMNEFKRKIQEKQESRRKKVKSNYGTLKNT